MGKVEVKLSIEVSRMLNIDVYLSLVTGSMFSFRCDIRRFKSALEALDN